MSGIASNIIFSGGMLSTSTTYIDTQPEAAGKVGKVLGVIAAIVIPFAAPAVFGAIASSGVLGSAIAGAAASGGFIGGLTTVIGSAVTGGIMNAAVAYAGGARGGDVWRAAGSAALSSGLNAGIRGVQAGMQAARTGATVPGAVKAPLGAPSVGASGMGSVGAATANTPGIVAAQTTGASGGIMQTLGNMFRGASQVDLSRVGAAIVNAAVNGQSMGRLDGLVAQQRAELEALRQTDQAQYAQRISAAQQLLADADKNDPSWMARMRMADIAGMEANQFRQAMRNIAVRQGGSLDQGQRTAYERSASLHTGRSKALAWGQGWGQGVQNQAALRAQGAGLLTSPNYGPWQAETELLAGQQRARDEAARSTAGGFVGAFSERDYRPSTSPDPSAPSNQNQNNDPWQAGLNFGRGG